MDQRLAALVLSAVTTTVTPAHAQGFARTPVEPASPPPLHGPRHVVALNPLGLLGSGYLAGEYEGRVTTSITFGIGAGTMQGQPSLPGTGADTPPARLTHGDLFARWYFTGTPFDGLSIGVRAGLTTLPAEKTYPGLGLDLHRSWTLGPHGVANLGWGMKRVFGGSGTAFDQRYVPWLKAHLGVAF